MSERSRGPSTGLPCVVFCPPVVFTKLFPHPDASLRGLTSPASLCEACGHVSAPHQARAVLLNGSSSPRCRYREQPRVRTELHSSVRKDGCTSARHRGPSTGTFHRGMTKTTLWVRMPVPSGPERRCSFVQRERDWETGERRQRQTTGSRQEGNKQEEPESRYETQRLEEREGQARGLTTGWTACKWERGRAGRESSGGGSGR